MPGTSIHINRRRYETNEARLTGREVLGLAGLGDDHDLFALHSEGDRSGGRPVGLDESIEIHVGQHFRAVPGNRNFG